MSDVKREQTETLKNGASGPTLTATLRRHSFRIGMVVAAILMSLIGLFANDFSLAIFLIVGHLMITTCILAGVNYGRPWMKDFGYGCIVPNIAGYVFAFLGIFLGERLLFGSLLLLLLLTTTGMGGTLFYGFLRKEDSGVYRIPIIGSWLLRSKERRRTMKSDEPTDVSA